MNSLGLRATVAVTTAILVLGLTLAKGLFVTSQAEHTLTREIGDSMTELARSLARQLDQTMWGRANQIAALSQIDSLKDPAVAQATIDELKRRDPTIAWMGATNRQGDVVAASGNLLLGKNVVTRPVHVEGMKGLFVGDVHEAVALKGKVPHLPGETPKFVDVSAPLRDMGGTAVGVLAVHYSWDWARTTLRDLTASLKGREGLALYILSADGNVLIGPDEMVGKPLPLDWRTEGWSIARWADGATYLTGVAHGRGLYDYAGLGWTAVARQPIRVVEAETGRLRTTIVVAGAVLAALFSALGWFAAGRIARPLVAITEAAERIRRGEGGVAIPNVGGSTEIGRLSAALRDLIESLTNKDAALMRLEDIAYEDRLTALPNRRYFEQYVEASTSGSDGGGDDDVHRSRRLQADQRPPRPRRGRRGAAAGRRTARHHLPRRRRGRAAGRRRVRRRAAAPLRQAGPRHQGTGRPHHRRRQRTGVDRRRGGAGRLLHRRRLLAGGFGRDRRGDPPRRRGALQGQARRAQPRRPLDPGDGGGRRADGLSADGSDLYSARTILFMKPSFSITGFDRMKG
ncbi:HAMP domain-containing protein [Azospirillum doebereinerae]|nr:cache and HAMP domain-containing protein [Azospirillum doebereinerae]MCG5242494.1 HAMP domain-containing protein [Azospirillum doebereinerae]